MSRISEAPWEDYEAFAGRDLSGLEVVYLFADAIYESLRQQPGLKEGILVTRGILSDGSKALIYLSLGSKESYDHWPGHSSGNVATPRLARVPSLSRRPPSIKKAPPEEAWPQSSQYPGPGAEPWTRVQPSPGWTFPV